MSGDNTLQAAVAEMQKAAAELRGDGAYSCCASTYDHCAGLVLGAAPQPPSGGAVDRWEAPPCIECGAVDAKDAETKCICAGDKDDCHGCHLWPDGDTAPPSAPVGVEAPTLPVEIYGTVGSEFLSNGLDDFLDEVR